jgi:hypothetical protein
MLVTIQAALLERAIAMRDSNIHDPKDYEELKQIVQRGWAFSYWCESKECEARVKEDTKATTRCMRRKSQSQSLFRQSVLKQNTEYSLFRIPCSVFRVW